MSPRTVLVVATRQIGDVLLTTPLIREVKQRWPQAAVDVLGFQGTLGMLRGNPDVRELVETPSRLGFAGGLKLVARLWRRYDLGLVADVGDRAHLIGAVAARERAGIVPAKSASNWWKKALLSRVVTSAGDLGDVHVVDEKLALVTPGKAGVVGVSAPRVVPPPATPAFAGVMKPYVVVHAPSMWPYKQWPADHFKELVRRLSDAGHKVVLTGGPSQADGDLVASLEEAEPRAAAAGVLDFGPLTALVRGAALYIGPDTSISHLAAATGVPVIAIFGPTNPQRWAPWPASGEAPVTFVRRADAQHAGNVTVLQADLPCVPCGKAGCEDHRRSRTDCLPAITPERVAAEALRILAA